MSLRKTFADLITSDSSGMLDTHPNWSRVRLGDVARLLSGFAFESERFSLVEGTPLIRIRDLSDGHTSTFYQGDYDPVYLVNPRDLLVGLDGDFRICVWGNQTALLNQRLCKITVNDELYSKDFLVRILPGYLDAINRSTSSITVKHLSSRTLADIPLPLPPRSEQARIAEELEVQISRREAGVASLESAKAKLENFRLAILHAAISGSRIPDSPGGEHGESDLLAPTLDSKNTESSRSWMSLTIGDVCRVSTGATPSRSNPSYFEDGDVPWITSTAVNQPLIVSADQFVTKKALKETNTKVFPSGSLLVAMYGEGKTRGKVSELGIDAATNQAVAVLVFEGENLAYKDWVRLFLEASYTSIRQFATGGVQPNLNLSLIRRLPLLIPPEYERRRILAQVDERLKTADRLQDAIEAELRRSKSLEQALIVKAVRGELVPHEQDGKALSELERKIETWTIEDKLGTVKPVRGSVKVMQKPRVVSVGDLVDRLREVGGTASPERLLVEAGLSDDVDYFLELLRQARNDGMLEVPLGAAGINKRIEVNISANKAS